MNNKSFKYGIVAMSVALIAGCQTTVSSADNLYNQYRAKPNNKAFAIGTNNVAGAAWGSPTTSEAVALAKKTCVDSGGNNCSVTEVNGNPVSTQAEASTVNNFNIVSQGTVYRANTYKKGSGFFVNHVNILTTSDMIDDCAKINYERSGQLLETTVVRVDKRNNIAVLKALTPNESYATISLNKQTIQGDRAYTYGYVLSDVVNAKTPTYQGKITDGIISSASGSKNDVRIMKTTNSVDQGNVGGPVIAENGAVIGLVTDDIKKESIKSSMFTIFLNESSIDYKTTSDKKSLPPSKIAEKSKQFSVPLVCLNQA
ncbi:trypsin-like peptidase domain-containing protein [Photobacterium rosenbergii]|uniref:Trypsin-like peptidase domain-containing protein n=1 Tax=Photobacterium rosenbergii TaxID=294936 RepID=A0ABU3ZBK4_9GAMM|nr:trypsin-like peptidase domain-containing protein [Photobacterium rosenbergii]MDV5167495.1 trypsin-like peptidase domain-containing protein [Photobacterium rosenbergii]